MASEGVPEGSIEFDVAVVESALHACAHHGAPIEFDVAVVEVWGLDGRACMALPATKGHVALMLRQHSSMAESSMTDVDVL